MIRAVFDTSVLVAGAGWRGEAHICLIAMARRRVRVFTSQWILDEFQNTLTDLESRPARDPFPVLAWFTEKASIVTPAPTGKRRSRDPKDDPILGTALAGGASYIVSYDRDLLDLEKPFGIEIIRPQALLRHLQRPI